MNDEDYSYVHSLFFTEEEDRKYARSLLYHLDNKTVHKIYEDDDEGESQTPTFELCFWTMTRLSLKDEMYLLRTARPSTCAINRMED